jgi:hypothetical protein
VADDLVSCCVEDCHLALTDGNERISAIADLVQHVADGRGQLFAHSGECCQLGDGERGDRGEGHSVRVAPRSQSASRAASIAVATLGRAPFVELGCEQVTDCEAPIRATAFGHLVHLVFAGEVVEPIQAFNCVP